MSNREYSRIELALNQLEVAISIFLEQGCMASVITLAGAAEEVLGKSLSNNKQESSLEGKLNLVKKFKPDIRIKDFYKEENRVRNILKHFDTAEKEIFEADLEDVACWMLVRACENSNRLGFTPNKMDEFQEWFYENIVGEL